MARESKGVTGLGGVFFKAKDPKKMAAWYRRHLGIPVKGDFAVFGWTSSRDKKRKGQTVWALFPEGSDYFGKGGSKFMINYRVRNLKSFLARLKKEGVKVDEKTEDYPYGKFGWAYDLEGNKLEFWEPPASYSSSTNAIESE